MTSTFTSATEQRPRFLSDGYIPIPAATPDPKDAGIFCGLRNGPKARTFDRLLVYAPVDLRAWASEKVGGQASTTSQY